MEIGWTFLTCVFPFKMWSLGVCFFLRVLLEVQTVGKTYACVKCRRLLLCLTKPDNFGHMHYSLAL